MTAQSTTPPAVGQLLAERRRQRGLSLQSLAKISGVSKSMISQIENGQVNPTLAVVWKLATGLGLKLQDLLEGELTHTEANFQFLTDSNCPTLASKEHGYRIQILSTIEMVERVELYLVEFQGSGQMPSEPHSQGTVETLTCLRGDVEVVLPNNSINKVKAIESCRYHADVPHTIRCTNPKGALIYLVVKFDLLRAGK